MCATNSICLKVQRADRVYVRGSIADSMITKNRSATTEPQQLGYKAVAAKNSSRGDCATLANVQPTLALSAPQGLV